MRNELQLFNDRILTLIEPYLNRPIIIFGANGGGYRLKTWLKDECGVEVKAMMDRWKRSPEGTVLHLYSMYYALEDGDVIMNMTYSDIRTEFEDIGEDWSGVDSKKVEIIPFLESFFENDRNKEREFSFYDWLEDTYNVDIIDTISRKNVNGIDAHGYYPTDIRIIEKLFHMGIITKEDAVFDFGCGKGGALISLLSGGIKYAGGVEYTRQIYDVLLENAQKMEILVSGSITDDVNDKYNLYVYCDDAVNITRHLDSFNVFLLFNPFGQESIKRVFSNIIDSCARKKRTIRIVYAEPMGHKFLVDSGHFELKNSLKLDFFESTYWTYVYQNM